MSTTIHGIGIVAVAAIVTAAIRFLPFIFFPDNRELPKTLVYLSSVLPAAIMGMLLVYCFKSISVVQRPYGIPELIASAPVVAIYIWKKNFLVSIAAGTVVYMLLLQTVFA